MSRSLQIQNSQDFIRDILLGLDGKRTLIRTNCHFQNVLEMCFLTSIILIWFNVFGQIKFLICILKGLSHMELSRHI